MASGAPSLAGLVTSMNLISSYQSDAEKALRLFYTRAYPDFDSRFLGYSTTELASELGGRLSETDTRSSFFILAKLEAAFRLDYQNRCRARKKDPLSIALKSLYRQKKLRVRLEDELLATWAEVYPQLRHFVSQLRSAFKFRHWLAHGQYWKYSHNYDYVAVYTLATVVFTNFPFSI